MGPLLLPGVRWAPLPEADRQPRIVPTQVIVHTVVGSSSPGPYFARGDVGAECHLWVDDDETATLWQFMSLNRQADANYRANRRTDGSGAISIETADQRDPAHQPWSDAQMHCIALAMADLHKMFPAIPFEIPTRWDAPGMGYHTLFPNEWTNVPGKTCPGQARKDQFPRLLELARAKYAGVVMGPHPKGGDVQDVSTNAQLGDDGSATVQVVGVADSNVVSVIVENPFPWDHGHMPRVEGRTPGDGGVLVAFTGGKPGLPFRFVTWVRV